jgi:outer membrane protein assembly factor BamB
VGSSVLLDRRLVVNTMTEVLALDTRSGAVLWRRPVLSESDQLFSDGRLVVLPVNEQGSHTLTALDATDGRVRWSAAAPDHVQEWTSSGGLLYALRTDDVVAFGSP